MKKKTAFDPTIFVLGVITTAAFVIVAPFIIVPVFNNVTLYQFSGQLSNSELPNNTSRISTKSVCGKLNGNGNGMDFAAVMLIQSDLSQGELQQYFTEKKYNPAKNEDEYGDEHECMIEVSASVSSIVCPELLFHRQVVFSQLEGLESLNGYYFVILYDGGYDAAFDVRGH